MTYIAYQTGLDFKAAERFRVNLATFILKINCRALFSYLFNLALVQNSICFDGTSNRMRCPFLCSDSDCQGYVVGNPFLQFNSILLLEYLICSKGSPHHSSVFIDNNKMSFSYPAVRSINQDLSVKRPSRHSKP
jgi:hypothetical protein